MSKRTPTPPRVTMRPPAWIGSDELSTSPGVVVGSTRGHGRAAPLSRAALQALPAQAAGHAGRGAGPYRVSVGHLRPGDRRGDADHATHGRRRGGVDSAGRRCRAPSGTLRLPGTAGDQVDTARLKA